MTRLTSLLISFAALATAPLAAQDSSATDSLKPDFTFEQVAPMPQALQNFALGRSGSSLLLAGGSSASGEPQSTVYQLEDKAATWKPIGTLPSPLATPAATSTASGMVIIGSMAPGEPARALWRVSSDETSAIIDSLPELPVAVYEPVLGVSGGFLYLAGQQADTKGTRSAIFLRLPYEKTLSFLQRLLAGVGFSFEQKDVAWQQLDPWPGDSMEQAAMAHSFETLHIFGRSAVDNRVVGYGYSAGSWRELSPPPAWRRSTWGVTYLCLCGDPPGPTGATADSSLSHTDRLMGRGG